MTIQIYHVRSGLLVFIEADDKTNASLYHVSGRPTQNMPPLPLEQLGENRASLDPGWLFNTSKGIFISTKAGCKWQWEPLESSVADEYIVDLTVAGGIISRAVSK